MVMDPETVGNLLKAIRDAVQQKDDDIALPVFDPDKSDCGAKSWCDSIDTLRADLKWSSIRTAAKAGCNANIPSIQAHLNEINIPEINIDVRADRELAYQRLCSESNKFKSRFDTVRRDSNVFDVGNTVYVNQDHRRHDKLSPRFKGPYEIIAILPNDRYSLRGIGNLRNITVAKDKLRLWSGEWIDDIE
ncbi:hypothetical protein HW555_004174 [Spodoptera exigua]|uniref:Uncharacterized protein n=1 Tax=Spodoptera exigua TaxID=7107 RepID=A0A835L5Q6_SPOEX|nr:hypothetical protein HW555_004174 [Spodoptera exigua]